MIFRENFDEVSIVDLQALVDDGIPEGRQLEFKSAHYGRKDDDKREFAADVSAFANASGGLLLIGIEEKDGIASHVCGVAVDDPDGFVRMVVDSIRTSFEPPIRDFRVRWVPTQAPLGVLMVKVERSWSGPHRVIVARDHRFFIRDENGKHPMSVSELRYAFSFASEVEERIRRFREESLLLLVNNEGPLAISGEGDPRLILHVVPRATFTDNIQISLDNCGATMWPWPLGARGGNTMYSLDGLVCYAGPEDQSSNVRAFSTLFRNGIAEAVSRVAVGGKDAQKTISLTGIEGVVISALNGICAEYKVRCVPYPCVVLISLVGVRGLSVPQSGWSGEMSYPYRADRIVLPELTIEAGAEGNEAALLLKPLFDLMWNAFGKHGSPNFDKQGVYVRR